MVIKSYSLPLTAPVTNPRGSEQGSRHSCQQTLGPSTHKCGCISPSMLSSLSILTSCIQHSLGIYFNPEVDSETLRNTRDQQLYQTPRLEYGESASGLTLGKIPCKEQSKHQLISAGFCCSGEHKIHFIPGMIGPFLGVTLVPQPEVRNIMIPIFHDMMDWEQRKNGNFKQVRQPLAVLRNEPFLPRKVTQMARLRVQWEWAVAWPSSILFRVFLHLLNLRLEKN